MNCLGTYGPVKTLLKAPTINSTDRPDLIIERMTHPRTEKHRFLPRDYIATGDGFIFAVVGYDAESSRVFGNLRYLSNPGAADKVLKKVPSDRSARVLREHGGYLWHCPRRDCVLPAVPVEKVVAHFRPEDGVAQVLYSTKTRIRRTAGKIIDRLLAQGIPLTHLGVTGSILLGCDSVDSDMDFVLYGHDSFELARAWVRDGLLDGEFDALNKAQWQAIWKRRGCPLDLAEYCWHEVRKFNKGIVDGFRFDINLVQERLSEPLPGKKVGVEEIEATVEDASSRFEWPATYHVDHPTIPVLQTFTATYFGQAEAGEQISARGNVELLGDGSRRMVVGDNREADGHYLRVKHPV